MDVDFSTVGILVFTVGIIDLTVGIMVFTVGIMVFTRLPNMGLSQGWSPRRILLPIFTFLLAFTHLHGKPHDKTQLLHGRFCLFNFLLPLLLRNI